MFVGRVPEIRKLEQMYASRQFEFAVFYGRRRVGKTTLINEFCHGKKAIFFTSLESTEKENLESLSRAVFEVAMPGMNLPAFSSYEQLLDYVLQLALDQRLILVIDEYPYLAQAKPAISSILQAWIDHKARTTQLFLILCGSSMSFMVHQVLDTKSPLYGRRTAQFKIHPFTYFEAREMLQGFSNEDQAALYGVTGGVPEYLSRVNQSLDFRDNIIRLFLDPAGRLFEEPANLLKQELRDPAAYNAIIMAIADGASRLNDIAGKAGLVNSACSNLLAALIALGLVRKEIPITEYTSRKTIYRLDDQMFRFWYRFVYPNLSSLQTGHGERIYDLKVKPELPSFMGFVFEQICLDYLNKEAIPARLPFLFSKIGRWWGNNPQIRREEEIDILAFDKNQALFGECKWTNCPVDQEVLTDLQAQSKLFQFSECYYYLFAKSGFTERCQKAAKNDSRVKLVTFTEMCE